jgi:nucleoside permease NupC
MELKLISLFGWLTMIAAAWAISYNRKKFPWRTVIWGIGLQFVLALLILKTPWGGKVFEFAGKVVQKLIQFSTDGTKFVFGPLADGAVRVASWLGMRWWTPQGGVHPVAWRPRKPQPAELTQ